MERSWILLCVLLCACTPVDGGMPAGGQFQGGVVQQATLDGSTLPGPGAPIGDVPRAVEPPPAPTEASPEPLPEPSTPEPLAGLPPAQPSSPPFPPESTPDPFAVAPPVPDTSPASSPWPPPAATAPTSPWPPPVAPPGEPPPSDQPAVAALSDLAGRVPDPLPPPDETRPCAPGEESLLTVEVADLSLVQTWPDSPDGQALLRSRGGAQYVVQRGTVVGPTGARVVGVTPGEVVLAEIQFSLSGEPVMVQQLLRLRPPR
jgi:hypothetical protein